MGKKTKKQHEPEAEMIESTDEEVPAQAPEQEPQSATEEKPGLSQEEQLTIELLQAREEAKKNQDLYLRAMAEMDNLRKRSQREKEELGKFANESILREVLPVIDNLERAVEHAEKSKGDNGLLEGVQMTLTHFFQVLNRFGVEPVISLGLPFDPALHQAIGQLETEEYPVNTVAQEMQKGYLLNNRLLRPALVMVAKSPPAGEAKQEVEQEPSSETDKS